MTGDSPSKDRSWDPESGSFRDTVVAINFVADAGKLMLESSTSVSEVQERLVAFLPAVGLDGCSLDSNMSSLMLSYWRPGQAMPITTMRSVTVATPRLGILSGTVALLDQVENHEKSLQDAVDALRQLEETPDPRRGRVHLALLVSVVGWVLFLDGLDFLTLLVAVLATALTFPTDNMVRRLRLPELAGTFLAALIVAAVPNLLAAAGLSIQVGPAVVGALFIYLPGRQLVSSVIDGLANAPLSSISRGLQALVAAGFLALGMLVGNQIGAGLGLSYNPDVTATPIILSVLGAMLGVFGLAVAWGMPRAQVLPTLLISAGGWLVVSVAALIGEGSGWPTYALAAGLVGAAGALVATRQRATASGYTGMAILPLVPGFALYSGMLAISQGNTQDAWAALGEAGTISIAIAVGVAIGLSLGRDSLAIVRRLTPASDK